MFFKGSECNASRPDAEYVGKRCIKDFSVAMLSSTVGGCARLRHSAECQRRSQAALNGTANSAEAEEAAQNAAKPLGPQATVQAVNTR